MRKLVFLGLILSLALSGCSTGTERIESDETVESDSGTLTGKDLESAATKFAGKIGSYFKQNPNPDGIFVANRPTRNDTTEIIPVDLFDSALVSELRKKGIYTVRLKTRKQALDELAFSQSGMTENTLSIGKMRSPNYFLETIVTENMYRSGGERIFENTIAVELISVESQLAVWNDRIVIRKRAANRSSGVEW